METKSRELERAGAFIRTICEESLPNLNNASNKRNWTVYESIKSHRYNKQTETSRSGKIQGILFKLLRIL